MGDEAETELSPGVASSASAAIDHGRFVPGTILDARYRIVSLLGRGGMGEVYRAEDLKLGETVALKFLPEKFFGNPVALERFRREAKASSAAPARRCRPSSRKRTSPARGRRLGRSPT